MTCWRDSDCDSIVCVLLSLVPYTVMQFCMQNWITSFSKLVKLMACELAKPTSQSSYSRKVAIYKWYFHKRQINRLNEVDWKSLVGEARVLSIQKWCTSIVFDLKGKKEMQPNQSNLANLHPIGDCRSVESVDLTFIKRLVENCINHPDIRLLSRFCQFACH